MFNQGPSQVKNFYIVNYEGSDTWNITNIFSDTDTAADIAAFNISNDDLILSGFKKQDNKYYSHLINNTAAAENEIVFGSGISGIKGFFTTLKLKTDDAALKELFSVSTNYNISSY